jgi:DNA-binding response OmpR family regulator
MEVLIIHRQDSFLQKVREKFLSGGWHATTTQSGLDGLMIARHQRFDLILCGFDLPVVSGTELVRSLRMLSMNRATPVFMLTEGKANEWQEEMAVKLEAHTITLDEVEAGNGRAISLNHIN